ncbi:MAG: CARDB domain-containing protein, partial [Candidatus ainarchaeum sp.]|nr:CARDB domain-containing protein [Candidatus ainarchaeum sp.]
MTAVLLFMALGFAQSASGPIVQVVDYNIVPDDIYSGSTGQLELTLENSGTETAKSVTVYYNYNIDYQSSVYVGQIGSGAEAITTIPFKVPDNVNSGMFTLTLDIYYLDEDELSSKHSMASIPVTISQHDILEVKTLSLSKDTLRKGDTITVELEITNTGGVMNNVVISSANSTQFSLSGTTQQRVGDIPSNSSTNVTVPLSSSSSTETGKYLVPLKITYNDALQNVNEETVYVGPVTVSSTSSSFKVSCEPMSSSEIGSKLAYNITLENPGESVQSVIIVIEDSDVFTPIGQNTLYFDDIQPGESRSEIVYLGIDSASSSGYYLLPMTLKTNND